MLEPIFQPRIEGVIYNTDGCAGLELACGRVLSRDLVMRHARPLREKLRTYSKESLIDEAITQALLSDFVKSVPESDFEEALKIEAQRLVDRFEKREGNDNG